MSENFYFVIHKNEVLLKNYLQVLLVVFILFSSNANAQQYIWHKGHDVDSLLEVIVKQDGYDRIKTLNHLAYSLYFIDFEVSKQYAEEAMDLSEKLGYKEGIAEAYRNLGYIYWYGGDYPEALKKCHKSMTLYEELNNRYKLARLYEVIAGIHYNCKNIQKAQEYVNTAMNIFKEKATDGGTVGNARDTVRVHMRLAFLFGETGLDLKKALHGYKAYRDAAKENDAKEVELFINTWYTGYIYHMLGQWDSARICFDEALE